MRSGGGGRLYGRTQRSREAVRSDDVADRTRHVEAVARGTSLVPAALSHEKLTQALQQLHVHYAQEALRGQHTHGNLNQPSSSLLITATGQTNAATATSRTAKAQSSRSTKPLTADPLSNYAHRGVTSPQEIPPNVALHPSSPPSTSALSQPTQLIEKPLHMPLLFGHDAVQPTSLAPNTHATDGHRPSVAAPAVVPFMSTCSDVLSRCGLPTAERVRSVFAAAEAHSELGAMLQWFAMAVVRLFTEGLAASSVLSFAEEWSQQMAHVAGLAHGRPAGLDAIPPTAPPTSPYAPKVSAALNAYAFELQGVPSLFTFIWARLAALEAATVQAAACHPSTALAAEAAVLASAAASAGADDEGDLRSYHDPTRAPPPRRTGPSARASLASTDALEGGADRRRTMAFTPASADTHHGARPEPTVDAAAERAEDGADGLHHAGPSTAPPLREGLTTDVKDLSTRGVSTFSISRGRDQRTLSQDGHRARLTPGREDTSARQTGKATSTTDALRTGSTRPFAGTAHAFSKIPLTFHTPPQGPEKLWSVTVPPSPSAGVDGLAALVPLSQLSSRMQASPPPNTVVSDSDASTAAGRRSPAALSVPTRADTNSGVTTRPHALTFHELSQRERRAQLQRELGVKQVRAYGAERDVADYMRDVDAWRAELMEDAPSSQPLLVSTTGASRTLPDHEAPVHKSPSTPTPQQARPPSPALSIPTAQPTQPLESRPSLSGPILSRSPPSVPVLSPSGALGETTLCGSKTRMLPRTTSVAVAEASTTAPATVGLLRAPSLGREMGSRTSTGMRQRSSTRSAPNGRTAGSAGTTSRATVPRQQERARRRDWLDPLVAAGSSSTDLPPTDYVSDDDEDALP